MNEEQLTARTREFIGLHVVQSADLLRTEPALGRQRLQAAACAGLTGIQVPEKLGGSGLSFRCKANIATILAGADFGLAMSWINTHNVAADLARWLDQPIANTWLPGLLSGQMIGCTALTEPLAGSDFSAIRTVATRVPGGWRLDGEKSWIINGKIADVMLVYAQTQPGQGAPGIACFVVDARRAGFERDSQSSPSSVASSFTGGFHLKAYIAHEAELIHPPGTAFSRALASINGARVSVAAMCCGMVAESLRIANEYGQSRLTFGKSLASHQGWRWSLADAAIDLHAAQLMVAQASAQIDAGKDAQDLAAKTKVFATRMAQRHIAALMHALGAQGLRDTYPLMRHLQATQVATLTDGSTEMLLERISKNLNKTLGQ